MARIQFASAAVEDIDRLVEYLDLPADARSRVKRSVTLLADHPLAGRELTGRWQPLRFWVGPWSWMILIYEYDEAADTVTVVTVQDARASTAPYL